MGYAQPLTMFDAAYAPSLDVLVQHGAAAASHYLTRSFRSTSFSLAASRARHMGAAPNWEGYASELKYMSRKQGQATAEEALAALDPAAFLDPHVAVIYSADFDLTNLACCDEAFRGINDVHRSSVGRGVKVGVYGEGGLLERLWDMTLIQVKGWLSMSEGFGGFHHALIQSGKVGMVQNHFADGRWRDSPIPGTDCNTLIDPVRSGIWWPAGSPYSRVTTPVAPQEVHMAGKLPEVFVVDEAECIKKRKTWPGFWMDYGDQKPRHIATVAELQYRWHVQGLAPRKISIARFVAIGGVVK